MRKSSPAEDAILNRKKRASNASRFSSEYWRERIFRPAYEASGDRQAVQEWYAQVQHGGRREKFPLGTNNKEEAARRAGKFYQRLRSDGWEVALKAFCPGRFEDRLPSNPVTIGDYLDLVRPLLRVRPRTFEGYAYALRKIARETTGYLDRAKSRFHPKSHDWRKTSDQIPIVKLTPAAINEWKDRIMTAAGQSSRDRERAARNINSFLRSAKALFSSTIRTRLTEKGLAVPPSPFENVRMEEQGDTRYSSNFNAADLLKTAREELLESDKDAWRVVLLALGAGLRRGEIDALSWKQVDTKAGVLRICRHGSFDLKTGSSEDSVMVDSGLLSLLRDGNAEPDPNTFVIAPTIQAKQQKAGQYYRCEDVFDRVTKWLRNKGIDAQKPLHQLRKEFGSIICANADVYVASRQLRHAQLSTTAAFYVDGRRRVSVPITKMLTESEKPDAGKEQKKQHEVESFAGGLTPPSLNWVLG